MPTKIFFAVELVKMIINARRQLSHCFISFLLSALIKTMSEM